MAKKVRTKAEKKVKAKSTNKKGIVFQIQNKIGLSVTLVMAVVAVLCIIMVQTLVSESNETQLRLESESAAMQLEKYFAPFERMVEQQAVNTEIKSIINNNGFRLVRISAPIYIDFGLRNSRAWSSRFCDTGRGKNEKI